MSHEAQNRSDKKSDETAGSIKNERQTPIGVQTVEAPLSGNVDPVYAAKAQALNDAIQSIGMGRYQVIPLPLVSAQSYFRCLLGTAPFILLSLYLYISCRAHYKSFIVGLVHCSWFWILCG